MMPRRSLLLAALATALVLPSGADAAATSSNWAGYAASRLPTRFRRVSATWTAPTVSCAATGRRRYSATWVGLGGLHASSKALEQIGTEADCSAGGSALYTTWYELVPAAPVTMSLEVHPGDTISASAAVSGHLVRLFLADRTTGARFSRQLRASTVDTTSAEWIVEAPSACDGYTCQTLPLANFGTTAFANARATTTTGHTGAIADPTWSSTAIALAGDRRRFHRPHLLGGEGVPQAAPSDLTPTSDGFSVAYASAPPA